MEQETKPTTTTEEQAKKPWQSKTNWIALIIAIAAFFPQVQAAIAANPDMFAMAMSGVFIGLRLITKDKVVIK